MSEQEKQQTEPGTEEDLELTEQDAENVKGGYIPIGEGGSQGEQHRHLTRTGHHKGKRQ